MESSGLNFSQTLDKAYIEVRDIYKKLETTESNSSSSEYQKAVSDGITISIILWDRVHELDLFSRNETLDDMSTESLKYLTIPVMIGHFLYQKMTGDRLEILREVKKYYDIFIELITDYGFEDSNSSRLDIDSRDLKIKQYKENKILTDHLNILEKRLSEDNVDEDIKREYYLGVIKQFIVKVGSDFKLIKDEMFILSTRKSNDEVPIDIVKPNIKSFVITRNMMNNTVFGMGYKNLPKYSLEDFYIMQVEQGLVPYPSTDKRTVTPGGVNRIVPDENLEEEIESEKNDLLEDTHDDSSRINKINWDNYKDENRRGCGNTLNRG